MASYVIAVAGKSGKTPVLVVDGALGPQRALRCRAPADALVKMDGYDMPAMDRTRGKGCYCFVNGLL